MHGGEDYELLFASKPAAKFPKTLGGVKLTQIGKFIEREKPLMVQIDERGRRTKLEAGGWEHKIG